MDEKADTHDERVRFVGDKADTHVEHVRFVGDKADTCVDKADTHDERVRFVDEKADTHDERVRFVDEKADTDVERVRFVDEKADSLEREPAKYVTLFAPDATILSVEAPNLSHPVVPPLLALMDQKHHWAYPALTRPGLSRAQLLAHFRHEYLVYVRDFPVLLARALGQAPPLDDVRAALAENLYEEQTGGLSKTGPHPALFLAMMRGLGFEAADFADDDAWLHPAARAYRDFLREASAAPPWYAAVALLTIFVEGSVNERAELAGTFVRPRGDAAVLDHPLVKHYGCPPEAMGLRRAHAEVEGAHRADAWRIVVAHVPPAAGDEVVALCTRALAAWKRYRDGVAERMGLSPEKVRAA